MGELEDLIRQDIKAVEKNTSEVNALKAEIKAYRETSEKAIDFLKGLVNKLITFEQGITARWQAAVLKWGGWIILTVVGGLELLFRVVIR